MRPVCSRTVTHSIPSQNKHGECFCAHAQSHAYPSVLHGPMLTLLTSFCFYFTTSPAQKVLALCTAMRFARGCEKGALVCGDARWAALDIDKASADKKDELRHFPSPGSGQEISHKIFLLVTHTVLSQDDSQVWLHGPDRKDHHQKDKRMFLCLLSFFLFVPSWVITINCAMWAVV